MEDQSLTLSKHCMLAADPAEPWTTFTGLHDEMLFKCHYPVTLIFFSSPPLLRLIHLDIRYISSSPPLSAPLHHIHMRD